ncbi:MAG TPA: cytochrome c oxidase assembly protein [Spongiibacteraceae bacterium]|nr:cytochrome c oxidase assembly protein [Spongiibacteraceae bacterium]
MADKNIAKTAGKLSLVVVVMFAFVFVVMVPLYNTLCQALGINGKYSDKKYEVVKAKVDETRTVKVQFVAANAEGMPWQFHPIEGSVNVHPGALNTVEYYAKNVTGKDMVAQAVPSFVPARSAQYFHKTECFCFRRQPLKAGEEAKLALQFIVDQELPAEVSEITLSYTIFDVTEMDKSSGKGVVNR